jgi:hypothetical protein
MATVALVLGAVLASGMAAAATSPSSSAQGGSTASSPVIAAVGDMECSHGHQESPNRVPRWGKCEGDRVSQLLVDGNYDAFLAVGDLQYLHGAYPAFQRYYDRSFGRVKDITYPVPGNHEGYTKGFKGYFKYFGRKKAHAPGGYYSFDLGSWHIIGLNMQLCKNRTWDTKSRWQHHLKLGRCHPSDPQYQWLKHDLATHPNSQYPCTLAYWHQPLYKWSPWPIRKHRVYARPFFRLLYRAHADVVLNGHWHNYQRFSPMNPRGGTDPNGLAQIIVGMGGDTHDHAPQTPKPTGLAAFNGTTYGIFQMSLNPTSYDYKFVPAAGQPPFSDSGSAQCH